MSRVLTILVVVLIAAGTARGSDGEESLERARTWIRQGLLRDAQSELEAVLARSSGEASAQARLLLGNIAFERADYAAALERYEAVIGEVEASPSVRRAARDNAARAERLLSRRRALDRQASRLAVACAMVAAGAVLACVALARHAAPPPVRVR